MNNSIAKGVLGLGEASTAFYLKEIHKNYNESNEEFSTCPLLLYQIDFQELNPYLPNQFEVLIPRLTDYLNTVSNLGVTKLLVPNITLHETLDKIDHTFELCHPVHLTLEYLLREKITEVFLFGTLYTMNSDDLKEKFSDKGIDILRLNQEDQNWIDEFRTKVYRQTANAEQILEFQNLVKKYTKFNTVIIACTELSINLPSHEPACVDMANLQIAEFLK